MKLFFFIFLSVFSFMASSQQEYHLNGSYEARDGEKVVPVKFTLRWSEDNNLISGQYKDNHFAKKAQDASGSVNNLGRLFTVKFPNERGGVQSISVLTSQKRIDDTAMSVPISVVTRDSEGNPVTTKGITANFVGLNQVAQRQEEQCGDEFGALAGFCGIYEGVISEEFDPTDDCNLMTRPAIRLELNPEGSILLHLDRLSEIVEVPHHAIGRIRANPESTLVDVLSRSCRPLEGIDYPGDNCKRLNLSGSFTSEGDERSFEGTYTIVDELTDRRCRYRLSVENR